MNIKKIFPYVFFSFLAFLVIFPLLKPGYVLAMDLVFAPKLKPPGEILNTYLWEWFLYFWNQILPSQIIEKILFFLVLFLSSLGMYRLAPAKNTVAKLFAGTLYMINPFVYSRFLYGQLNLLIAYSLFPFVVKSIFNWLENPDWKKALKLSLWFSVISIIHLRTLSIIGIFFIVGLTIKLLQILFRVILNPSRTDEESRTRFFASLRMTILKSASLFKKTLTIIISFLILNFYWLWNFIGQKTERAQTLFNVDDIHLEMFKTVADPAYGLFLNILGLYGFWGDLENRYLVQKEIVPFWPILIAITIALSVIGLVYGLKQTKSRIPSIIIALNLILAVVFVSGIFHDFLFKELILFKGLREPQKFTALIVLGYSFLGVLGLEFICSLIKKYGKTAVKLFSLAALIIPIAYSPGMFWGFMGQLEPVNYPQDWYQLNERLDQDQEKFKILFLPWHQFLSFNFTEGKIIQNPAEQFFDKYIIQGDNIEMGQIYTQSKRPQSLKIQSLIAAGQNGQDIGRNLADLEIKYVILAKTVDWKNYNFLDQQKNLRLIQENGELKFYQRDADAN